ncbi:glycosyltransferase family 9 protein [Candidatus Margulisiibacteriota bacterium]
MRILIIKLGAIGDVIRATFILRGLREKHQTAEIDWITDSSARDILINNPLINRLFTWEERGELKDYDLVIGLEDELAACELASQLKPKNILGAYAKDGKVLYTPSAWFDMSAISKFGLDKANELKKNNRKSFQQHMAELLDIKVGPYLFDLTRDEIETGQKYVKGLGISKQDKVVGMNTGAGQRWPLKALSAEKTIELVNKIKNELGMASLILGGAEEKARNAVICKETGMPNAGLHPLRNFAAVINQCRLVVSSDSLAMHFAIALQKRTVAFFGPTSPFEIELYGLGARVFPGLDCLICYRQICDKDPNCMDVLAVNDLFKAVKREAERL